MLARSLLLLLLLCGTLPDGTDSYKILVYNSKFGHSHSNYLGRIADILADAGHNVTSLIPIMDASLADGTTKSRVIHVQPDPEVADFYDKPMEVNFFDMSMANPLVPIFVGPIFANTFGKTCKKVLQEPGLLEQLRAEKFDVYITENFDVCGTGIAEAIQPRSVIASSTTCLFGWQFDEFGVEQAVSYRPNNLLTTHDTTFRTRLLNLYGEFIGRWMFWYGRRAVNAELKAHFGPEYPTVAQQSANVAYVFTNSEPLIESAAPTSARIIDIPGIGAKTPKSLDKYWESVLTRRPKTILLSFGSIAKSILLSPERKAGILKAVSLFPDITFIWKYEEPEDDFGKNQASKLENLVLSKWMPQVDILNHPNLAIFITHGGMGSTQETALRGVPGIFIPIFGDQPRNAGMMQSNKLGVVFDKFDIHDGDKLAATIREVLGNKEYAENAKRLSKMLARKPFSSIEILIKTVEFAAEFGASPALRPQSVDMSLIEYNNLDVLAAAFVVLIVLAFVALKIVMRLLRAIGVKKVKKE